MMNDKNRESLFAKAGKDYAAGYLLMSIAISHIEDGDAELERLGLYNREVKMKAKRVQGAFDVFNAEFKKFLPKGSGEIVARDYDAISGEICRIIDEKL